MWELCSSRSPSNIVSSQSEEMVFPVLMSYTHKFLKERRGELLLHSLRISTHTDMVSVIAPFAD